jgi:hypothetical protein
MAQIVPDLRKIQQIRRSRYEKRGNPITNRLFQMFTTVPSVRRFLLYHESVKAEKTNVFLDTCQVAPILLINEWKKGTSVRQNPVTPSPASMGGTAADYFPPRGSADPEARYRSIASRSMFIREHTIKVKE